MELWNRDIGLIQKKNLQIELIKNIICNEGSKSDENRINKFDI